MDVNDKGFQLTWDEAAGKAVTLSASHHNNADHPAWDAYRLFEDLCALLGVSFSEERIHELVDCAVWRYQQAREDGEVVAGLQRVAMFHLGIYRDHPAIAIAEMRRDLRKVSLGLVPDDIIQAALDAADRKFPVR